MAANRSGWGQLRAAPDRAFGGAPKQRAPSSAWHRRDRKARSQARTASQLAGQFVRLAAQHSSRLPKSLEMAIIEVDFLSWARQLVIATGHYCTHRQLLASEPASKMSGRPLGIGVVPVTWAAGRIVMDDAWTIYG